ncbi:MAG: GNAT family N-acetyltransferase [Thermus sp.]|uniref:GNAT family N-acetyltransferase n=1 Tax=Thermus sp. TaxID=275 RepID=UPI00332B297F
MEGMRLVSVRFRPLSLDDAPLVHAIYRESPSYFAQIGMETPTLEDVVREISALSQDPRRRAFLIEAHGVPVGYLDYKLHYPEEEEATLSLLLIRESLQGNGLGQAALAHLEATLTGSVRRIYAVVYGQNPRARRFFQAQGYRFVKEGGPPLAWYAKELKTP